MQRMGLGYATLIIWKQMPVEETYAETYNPAVETIARGQTKHLFSRGRFAM